LGDAFFDIFQVPAPGYREVFAKNLAICVGKSPNFAKVK
jgi:hypothetical protein